MVPEEVWGPLAVAEPTKTTTEAVLGALVAVAVDRAMADLEEAQQIMAAVDVDKAHPTNLPEAIVTNKTIEVAMVMMKHQQ